MSETIFAELATDPHVEELISVAQTRYKKTRSVIGNLPDEQVLKIAVSTPF